MPLLLSLPSHGVAHNIGNLIASSIGDYVEIC